MPEVIRDNRDELVTGLKGGPHNVKLSTVSEATLKQIQELAVQGPDDFLDLAHAIDNDKRQSISSHVM